MKNTMLCFFLVMLVTALLFFPACKESDAINSNLLLDVTWQLQSIQLSESNVTTVVDTYTIQFKEDYTLSMMVDCNTCFGTYTSYGSGSIFFDSPSCTDVFCGADSVDNEFQYALTTAYGYEIEGDILRIMFQITSSLDPGYLTFKKIDTTH